MENSTLTGNSSLEDSTTSNSTTDSDGGTHEIKLIEIILGLFILLIYILATICLIIHLYKFFKSSIKQNLQIRNLTSYCACLLLTYLYAIISTDFPVEHSLIYRFIDLYLHIAISVLLLIMACYTCMCIVISKKAYHIPYSDDTQFIIYSVIGWVFPLLPTVLIFAFESSHYPNVIIILLIRLLATIPFFVSLWYIRSIGWNKTNIIKNFVIHLRLLVLTGVISIIPITIYGILLLFDKNAPSTTLFGNIVEVIYFSEGLIVGLCFTFRKGTFENTTESPIEMKNGYHTEVAHVIDGEDES